MKVLLSIVLLVFAVDASAQEQVYVRELATSAGVLPEDRILVRNASGYELSVWVALPSAPWRRLVLPPEHTVDINATSASLAIATASDDQDAAAFGKPPVLPAEIPASPVFTKPFFYQHLSGGVRAIFCWSVAEDIWRIQVFGESVCG